MAFLLGGMDWKTALELVGWLAVNEIRAFENMNPIEGGDTYLVPMNMTELGAEPTVAIPKNGGDISQVIQEGTQ